MPGQTYGHLTVVEPVNVSGNTHWRYRCVCGKEGVKRPAHIRTKGSCGCLRNKPATGHWINAKQVAELLGVEKNAVHQIVKKHNVEYVGGHGSTMWFNEHQVNQIKTARSLRVRRCPVCGEESVKRGNYNRSGFCSKECGRKSQIQKLKQANPRKLAKCKVCGANCFSKGTLYCSGECRRAARPVAKTREPIHVRKWLSRCRNLAAREVKQEEIAYVKAWRLRCRSATCANRYRRKRSEDRPQKPKTKAKDMTEALSWWAMKLAPLVEVTEQDNSPESIWRRKCYNALTNHRKRLARKEVMKSTSNR